MKFHSAEETYNRLTALEEKYNLFSYSFYGYSAWRLLRSQVANKFHRLFTASGGSGQKYQQLIQQLWQALRELPILFFPGKKKYFVKTCSSVLRENVNGKWRDVEFDFLLDNIGPAFKIEVPNNPLFRSRKRKALIPVDMTTDVIEITSLLLARFFPKKESKRIAGEIVAALKDEDDFCFLNRTTITRNLSFFYYSKQLHRYILKKIDPQFVLVSNTSEYPMWAAAAELSIETIEFQHGIFNHTHPDVLPAFALRSGSNLMLPDKLLLFGEYWKMELCHSAYDDSRLRVVGSPRIDHYREVRKNRVAANDHHHKCRLVLTTQGFAVQELISFITSFVELAIAEQSFELFIKLHPGYDTNSVVYDTAFAPYECVHIVKAIEEPETFSLLASSDIHLSISSACHYDAIGIGLPTVVLGLQNHQVVLPLVQQRLALFAKEPQDILNIIRQRKTLSLPEGASELFFKRNAIENICRELDANE